VRGADGADGKRLNDLFIEEPHPQSTIKEDVWILKLSQVSKVEVSFVFSRTSSIRGFLADNLCICRRCPASGK